MHRRPRVALLLAILALPLFAAAPSNTLDELVQVVRDGIEKNSSDQDIAHAVHRLNLKVRLDNRTAEELESLAPGPKTIAELERQRELTSDFLLPEHPPSFASPANPSPEELRDVLSETRRKALNYTVSLPDFMCTENVHRYEGPGKGSWTTRDSLTLQLTYFDHEEKYQLTAVNGHKTSLSYDDVGGALSKGEFASMLFSVFAPSSRTTFRWLNWTTLRKHTSYVMGFQIDPKDSTYVLRVGRYGRGEVSAVPGQHGYVYIDRETKEVLRISSDADSIPGDFPLEGATRILDYGQADVGGRMYLLPLHAEIRMMPRYQRMVTRNAVEFTAFRKFTGESTISFGDPGETPDDKTKPIPPVKK